MRLLTQMLASVTVSFNFFKVGVQVFWGGFKISRLSQPVVSIFGGHLLPHDSRYLRAAHHLASKLVDNDISVLTGGGPGIMEAASSGAAHEREGKIKSMGIGVRGLDGESSLNPYVHNGIMLDYFFARKYLLINYSYAFVIFPGGFGTIDELSDLLNLIDTKQRISAPIILYGKEFWGPYLTWIETIKNNGLIRPEGGIVSLYCVDTDEEALAILINYCERCEKLSE